MIYTGPQLQPKPLGVRQRQWYLSVTHSSKSHSHHTVPTVDMNSPKLWIDALPFDVLQRIALFVSDRKSGLDALNLAKTSPLQRHAVCAALNYTLQGCFATHAEGLVNDWVDVFEDVRVLQLHEHPPNFRLLCSPSLHTVFMEDEPLQLEAVAKSKIELDHLKLVVRYGTPPYLVCRLLAEVTFKTFSLYDNYCSESFLQNLDPFELVTACQGVEKAFVSAHYWNEPEWSKLMHFVTDVSSLRELYVDEDNLSSTEMLSRMTRLERIRIRRYESHVIYLGAIELEKKILAELNELILTPNSGMSNNDILALGEAIRETTGLESLVVKLSHGVERYFPQIPSLKILKIRWYVETAAEDDMLYYKANEGDVSRMIDGLPSLTALELISIRLSQGEVMSIIEILGDKLEEFHFSIDGQDVAVEQMLLTIVKALTIQAGNLTTLKLPHNSFLPSVWPWAHYKLTWNAKQELLLSLDRLYRRNPGLDVAELEEFIIGWPHEDDIANSEEDSEEDREKKKIEEARQNSLVLRRCRRGMNEEGGVRHLVELAGLLETGCEGLEQDVEGAIKAYRQAVWMGDEGEAFKKLCDLTENGSGEEWSGVKTGGALEVMLEMESRKLKTLPHFADQFSSETWSTTPKCRLAERVLQLAVDKGYIIPYASRLAELVREGYGDVLPNPERAVELYRCVVDHCEDTNALFWLATYLAKGYGNKPPNPAEARVYFERGVKLGCCDSMCRLGQIIWKGYEGCPPDPEAATNILQQASRKGGFAAAHTLGIYYRDGWEGNPADPRKAIEMFEIAITRQARYAFRRLGDIIATGYEDHPPDLKRAAELYERGFARRDMEAGIRLAELVGFGYEDVAPDPNRAVCLYEQVIEEADTVYDRREGLECYGYFLLCGSGDFQPDPTHAVDCFRKAIDMGYRFILDVLGDLYNVGYGDILRDRTKACELYLQASDDERDPSEAAKQGCFTHDCEEVKTDLASPVEVYRALRDRIECRECIFVLLSGKDGSEGV